MGLFEHFPYTNFHELNLDWIIQTIKEMDESVRNFISINSIKYANPIQWDITSQYEKNTVVLDKHGNAYLSVQPVPAGISLDRTEYWTVIGNFSELWENVKASVTPNDEGHNKTASADRAVGDWVWVNDTLYLITKAMTAGDKYVDGSNCQSTNIMTLYNNLRKNLDTATLNLQGQITNEATTRQNADNILQENINNESTARENADIQLASDIAKSGAFLNFKAFGAVGDGAADDTEAIKSCLAAAENRNVGISGNFGTYKVSDSIIIDGTKILYCHIEGTVNPTFNDKPCITVNDAIKGDYEFHVIGNDYNGGYEFNSWDNYNQLELPFKGIKINHCQESNFLLTARKCNTGISIESTEVADGSGCAYNTFNIPDCGDNAVSLDVMAKNNGWCNENLFIGVSVHDYSQNPNSQKLIGIRIWTNNSEYLCNNNVFVKPCLQCRGLPVLLNGATDTAFRDARMESSGKPSNVPFYVRTTDNSKFNVFTSLYGSDTNIYETPTDYASNLGCSNLFANSAYKIPFALWNFNKRKATVKNDAVLVEDFDTYYPGMSLSTAPTYIPGSVTDNGITITNGASIGRFIDLSASPVVMSIAHGIGIRLWVTLFDSNWHTINAVDEDLQDYNKSTSSNSMYATTIGGVRVLTDSVDKDDNLEIVAITNQNAKYAFVGVSGTNITFMELFGIETHSFSTIKCNVLPKKTFGPND